MQNVLMYVLLIVGFVLLIKGADFFVEGSASIAKIFKVPSVIIGLTIVAMGTSAPETAVSVSAALKGSNAIAVSNVVGSNFFNLLVVVGVCTLFQAVNITKDILKRDFPYSIAVSVLLLAFLADDYIFGSNPVLNRIEGAVFLVIFAYYIFMLVRSALKARQNADDEEIHTHSVPVSILFIVGGLTGVVLGGNMVVDNATLIAKSFKMSDTLIGLTIIALGTSLPELVTSVVASKKGENDMALGNVVGSNIFNILLVLGLSSLLSPIKLDVQPVIDTALLIVVNIVVLLMVVKDHKLTKGNGAVMLLMYILYTAYIFYRNYCL